MKIYIFGSCSGTEPFPERHHTAWALECMGRLYWFDAGECCAYTAHTMGVDLLSISDIFISHPHIDHVGGLPNLIWTVRKLCGRLKTEPKFKNITVHTPNADIFNGTMMLLCNADWQSRNPYKTDFAQITDGVLLQNSQITVTARHNMHMKPTEEGYQSFSFLIETDGKRIVYSGDIASPDELEPLIADGCDALLTETGHHDPVEICEYMKNRNIGHIYFLHHGRPIIHNYDELLKECRSVMPNVTFCNDMDVFEI